MSLTAPPPDDPSTFNSTTGDFETDTNSDGLANGWRTSLNVSNQALVTDPVTGSKAQYWEKSSAPTGSGQSRIRLQNHPFVPAGVEVTVTAYIKVASGTQFSLACGGYADNSETGGNAIGYGITTLTGNDAFQPITRTFTVTAGMEYIEIELYLASSAASGTSITVDSCTYSLEDRIYPVVTGLSTTAVYWQFTQQTYTQAAHNYLIAVNGVDSPLAYNGSWTTCSTVSSPSAPGQFKNVDNNGASVDITKFNDVIIHQQRLWFVVNDSTAAYYCDIGQVGGTLYPFDFGTFFPRGGALHKLATWTIDSSGDSGVQAILVAISTKGDVVLFSGQNPATSSTWSYIGTYQLGAPIGKRCTLSFQGELLFLSQDGLYPLSKYMKSTRADNTIALTYPITNTITRLISTYGSQTGFELVAFAGQNLLILNIPQPGSTTNHQYVMNTITGGWSRIIGWPARCFTVFNDKLYFGTENGVMNAFYGGYTDNADVNSADGVPIIANALSAFSSFADEGLDGVTKTIVGIKPFFTISSQVQSIAVGVNVDFSTGTTNLSSIVPPLPTGGALWGSALWDQAYWTNVSSIGQTYYQWFTPFAPPGVNVAVAVSVSASAALTWAKSQWKVLGGFAD